MLSDARVARIGQARQVTCEDLTAYLGMSGYAHYAGRAGMLLQSLCDVVGERYRGRASAIGQRFTAYSALRTSLEGLPGPDPAPLDIARLTQLAAACHTDPRDLESGLVRLTLAHHRRGTAPARAGAIAPSSDSSGGDAPGADQRMITPVRRE